MFNLRAACIACALLLLSCSPSFGILINQLDDFENGTVQNWGGGVMAPTNISTGGPSGANDNYLQISAVNDHLGTRNQTQWMGDWVAAGVSRVEMDLRNPGSESLPMRILVLGAGDPFTSTLAIDVPADSLWHHVAFDVTAGSMTNVGGEINDLATTLTGVVRLLIRNDPGDPDGPGGGADVTATLGIDNIRAAPEPTGLVLLLAGGLALRRRR